MQSNYHLEIYHVDHFEYFADADDLQVSMEKYRVDEVMVNI